MSVAGVGISALMGGFGRKPNIPYLAPINVDEQQNLAVQGNQNALGGIQNLASGVNKFNLDQSLAMTRGALNFVPGGADAVSGIIGSQLKGEIPADVQASLLRSGAARGFGSGTAGSGFSRNLTLRDLGLTSLGIQQQGLSNLQAFAPKAPLFNVSSMFRTPDERLNAAFKERTDQFQRNLLAEQVAAAPDPATAALGREADRFFNTIASYGMTAAGKAGGGGGGGMGG